jgi:hypothetical protein
MPLFECSECHSVDNTALTNWAWRDHQGKPPLCSACDPEIGTWHGRFERITAKEFDRRYPNAEWGMPRVGKEATDAE